MDLELKFKDGFIRYKKGLEERLNKAKNERQELIEKFTNGDLLTADDAKRNKRLADAIKNIKRALEKVAEVEFYDNVEKTVIALANPALTQKQKEAGIKFVANSFLAFNRTAVDNLSSISDLDKSELQNILHTTTITKRTITELGYEIHTLKKYGYDTAELEGKKQLEQDKLTLLEQFKGIIFNETELTESLRSLTNPKTPDGVKEATVNRYRKMIRRHKELKIDNLVKDIKEHPIDNIDMEPINVIENASTPTQQVVTTEETKVVKPIVVAPIEINNKEVTPQENIRDTYEGPRLIDKANYQQNEASTVEVPNEYDKLEGITPIIEPTPVEVPLPPVVSKKKQNTSKPFSSFVTEDENDEVYTFATPKTPFVFPEAEVEEELDDDEEVKIYTPHTLPKPIKNQTPTREESQPKEIEEEMILEETPDAEYEQIEDEFEFVDNSFKGKLKRGYHAAKDWLLSSFDYDDDYEIDEEYVDQYGNVYEGNPNSLKYKTKENLKKVGGWLKKSWKPIAGIAGSAIMVWSLCSVLKGCKKDETIAYSPEETTYEPTIETTLEPTTETTYANTTINNLIDKGYSEYNAILMADSFSKSTLDTVLSSPYNAAVENYATVKAFDYNYLNDYEEAKEIYGITSEKAVDYVNRSHKIMDTGFYTDLTINEIVGVLQQVDNKQIFLDETNPYNHSITAALTNIYNDYAFGNGSIDNSVKKVEALKYFAPNGSDLDNFLTKFADITISVLKSRGNAAVSEDTKQDMYLYLNVFANTFAGNTQDFNKPDENAVVTDTFDWNTAYITFIRPLMSMYITESNAEDFACLQINMLSNYEQWIQINGYCNEETRAVG